MAIGASGLEVDTLLWTFHRFISFLGTSLCIIVAARFRDGSS